MTALLKNQTVVVIGGSSGIGLAVAKYARELGARVVIASRNADSRLETLSGSPVPPFEACRFDITSEKDYARLLGMTGIIDHLVFTVRPDIQSSPFLATDIDKAKQAFDTKFWGQYRFIRTARPSMRDNGSITMTSGIAGEKIYPGASTMALINSATETLCRTLAVELSPLRVNAVSPGYVAPKSESVEKYAESFPLGRISSAEEMAKAYISLMTNTYATGTILVVDGGARLI